MNIPPEFPLPDKKAMLQRILDAPAPAQTPARRSPAQWLAVAAGVGVLALGVGLGFLLQRPPVDASQASPPVTAESPRTADTDAHSNPPTPTTSSTAASTTPQSSATAASRPSDASNVSPMLSLRDGKPVTVGDYTVSVPLEPQRFGEGFAEGMDYYWVEQCATTAGPVSPSQWVVAWEETQTQGQAGLMPALPTKQLAAGECVQGFVSFPKPEHPSFLAFAPTGKRLAGANTGPQVGASVELHMFEGRSDFDNFSVEVMQKDATPITGVSGFYAKVCVLKLPADAENGTTRISLDPWYMLNSEGEWGRPLASGGYSPAFPADARYKVGDCAEGWLSFADLPTAQVDWVNLSYSNALGDRAMWNYH